MSSIVTNIATLALPLLMGAPAPSDFNIVCDYNHDNFTGQMFLNTKSFSAAYSVATHPNELVNFELLNLEPRDCEGCYDFMVQVDTTSAIYIIHLDLISTPRNIPEYFMSADVYINSDTAVRFLPLQQCIKVF